ncbi:MAG TPA: hypothetical protein VN695_01155 [Streptosporangiaceae bacterium]|nr:hypothetical protein [Streptosporangiaceae bacterium]
MKLARVAALLGAAFLACVAACSCSSQPATAQGGCWYAKPQSATLLAVHLPVCTGTEADLQRTVFVNPLNMVSASEPNNAQEVCQVEVGGNDPTAWIGIWADSASSTAMGGGHELCQLAVGAGSQVRWGNFH